MALERQNLLFGLVYLPWQFTHLRVLLSDAKGNGEAVKKGEEVACAALAKGLARSIHVRNLARNAATWGGLVGLTWMTAYWATLIPMWVNHVVVVLSSP